METKPTESNTVILKKLWVPIVMVTHTMFKVPQVWLTINMIITSNVI
ncbi:MAG: hypothetical protein ACFFCS_14920 [Candidatus Hodarchaeota archaeon]